MSRVNPIKFGSVERLDEHHKAILNFIKNNPECTENLVVKAMEEQRVCSKMTTLRKLDELKEKGEIKDLLNEGEGRFHKLYVNENNDFNRINEQLMQIQGIIDDINQFIPTITSDVLVDDTFNFMMALPDLINEYLLDSLAKTDKIIHSEKDRQILVKITIKLMLDVTKMHRNLQGSWGFSLPKKSLITERDSIMKMIDYYKSKEFEKRIHKGEWTEKGRKERIDELNALIKPMNNLITKVDKLRTISNL